MGLGSFLHSYTVTCLRMNCFCLVFEFEHLNFFVAKQIADKSGSGKVFGGQQLVLCIIFSLRNASLLALGKLCQMLALSPWKILGVGLIGGGINNKKLLIGCGTQHN